MKKENYDKIVIPDPDEPRWFYHEDSNGYFQATWREVETTANYGDCIDLGRATIQDKSEAIALHDEMIKGFYTR